MSFHKNAAMVAAVGLAFSTSVASAQMSDADAGIHGSAYSKAGNPNQGGIAKDDLGMSAGRSSIDDSASKNGMSKSGLSKSGLGTATPTTSNAGGGTATGGKPGGAPGRS